MKDFGATNLKYKKIIRVFPRRTNMTPDGEYVFIGLPTLFIPDHEEVHISVTFTWDVKHALFLKKQWELHTEKPVLIGGPSFKSDDNFYSGLYLKKGVTITSRGCPNNCSFCLVPKREGKIRELKIKPGNIIQDNNLLACSDKHIANVFNMLSNKKNIEFSGGFEAKRINLSLIKELKKIKVQKIWLACDDPNSFNLVKQKIELLRSEGFSQNKIRCYVIIGKDQKEEDKRLKALLFSGCLPYAQLLQPNIKINYSKEWKDFQKFWARPAIYRHLLKIDKKEIDKEMNFC
jgi:radical SAM superfamily enzyme YgiQ (UPF0313 family)